MQKRLITLMPLYHRNSVLVEGITAMQAARYRTPGILMHGDAPRLKSDLKMQICESKSTMIVPANQLIREWHVHRIPAFGIAGW